MKRVVFGILVTVVGGAVAYLGLDDVKQAWASKSWPTTEGMIKSSEVAEESSNDGKMYSAAVTYSYSVAERQYEGKRISFGGAYSTSFRDGIQETVDRYPQGRKVMVRYDPRDPQTAALEAGAGFGAYASLVIGLLFSVTGLLIISGRLTQTRRKKPSKVVEASALTGLAAQAASNSTRSS